MALLFVQALSTTPTFSEEERRAAETDPVSIPGPYTNKGGVF